MVTNKSHVALLSLAATLAMTTVACDESQPQAGPGTEAPTAAGAATTDADALTKKRADELSRSLKAGAFPREEQKKENAEAFVYLAKHSKDTEVVAASLKAMAFTFTSYDKAKDKVLADGNYHKAVLARLDDKDSGVQAAAIAAAANSVTGKSPDEAVTAKIVELAKSHPTPEGRFAAIEQLWKVSQIEKDDKKLEPLVAALDAEQPWLVSRALFRLKGKLSTYGKKDEVQAKLGELLKHADPGVRGRAAEALSSMAGPDAAKREELAKLIMPLLADENPYTKSAACSSLAWLRYKPAIHEIIKLVDDETKNTYDIRGFNELNGNTGWVHHDGSAWSRVSDAALYALKSLSHETGEKFDYKVDAKKVEDDLKKAATEAKAWYAKVKGKIDAE